jgi:hypothetical protein
MSIQRGAGARARPRPPLALVTPAPPRPASAGRRPRDGAELGTSVNSDDPGVRTKRPPRPRSSRATIRSSRTPCARPTSTHSPSGAGLRPNRSKPERQRQPGHDERELPQRRRLPRRPLTARTQLNGLLHPAPREGRRDSRRVTVAISTATTASCTTVVSGPDVASPRTSANRTTVPASPGSASTLAVGRGHQRQPRGPARRSASSLMLASECSTARSHEAATLSPHHAPMPQRSVPSSPV